MCLRLPTSAPASATQVLRLDHTPSVCHHVELSSLIRPPTLLDPDLPLLRSIRRPAVAPPSMASPSAATPGTPVRSLPVCPSLLNAPFAADVDHPGPTALDSDRHQYSRRKEMILEKAHLYKRTSSIVNFGLTLSNG